jgi:prophage antirepressor-like protein
MELINLIDETILFNNDTVRIIGTYNEPWFIAKDICKILGIANVTESLRNIPEKWRGSEILSTSNGNQNMNIINESGLYKLIMRSNKPIAQKFQEHVCEVILPSIRKEGEYKLQSIIDSKNKELDSKNKELDIQEFEKKQIKQFYKKKIEIKDEEIQIKTEEKQLIINELISKDKEVKSLNTLINRKKKTKYRLMYSIYIISNPEIKNYYKIGSTKNRNGRLSDFTPGAPSPYKIEYSREVCNESEQTAIEHLLLGIFQQHRVINDVHKSKPREWLENIDLNTIKNEMDMLVNYFHGRKIFYDDEFILNDKDRKIKYYYENKNYKMETYENDNDDEEYIKNEESSNTLTDESSNTLTDKSLTTLTDKSLTTLTDESLTTLTEESLNTLTEESLIDESLTDDCYKDEMLNDDYITVVDEGELLTKACYICKEEKKLNEYFDRLVNSDSKEGTCKICYTNNKKILKKEKDDREIIIRKEGTKKCRKCNEIKEFHLFSKHGTSKDGFEYCCIECKIKDQTKISEKRCNTCRITKTLNEFNTFRLGHNKDCIKCENSNSKNEQNEITQNENIENSLDIKNCSNCKKEKNLSEFNKCSTHMDGYSYYCRECSTLKSKEYKETQKNRGQVIVKTEKKCSLCKNIKKVHENFYISSTSKDGYTSKCIDCSKKLVINIRKSQTT